MIRIGMRFSCTRRTMPYDQEFLTFIFELEAISLWCRFAHSDQAFWGGSTDYYTPFSLSFPVSYHGPSVGRSSTYVSSHQRFGYRIESQALDYLSES